jgi:ABC-type multidrug transport system ATPase subunit
MKIAIDRVSKQYGGFWALDEVSLDIAPGQLVALLGENGAGKSTLLCCMAGLVSPSRGEVRYDSQVFHRGRMDLRRRLMFLPDSPALFARTSLLRHISMCSRLYQIADPSEERVADILRSLGLLQVSTIAAAGLSRGQLYKAALAALLVVDPELWILDEPLASGMDPAGIAYFKREARAAVERGRTVLYTTQILDIAEKFSDRVCILEQGRVRLFGALQDLQGSAENQTLEEVFLRLRESGNGA